MSTANLGTWLRKTPQPRIVVVDGGKRIEVGNKGGKWRDLVRTIESLGASRVECLDGSGNILRALSLDDDDDDANEKKDSKPAPARPGCPACGVHVPDIRDFAQLLADAYERGANAQRDAYRSIFEENTKLVRLLAERLSRLELAWQGALNTQAELVGELAEANAAAATAASGGDELVGPLLAGMMQGQAARAVPAAAQPNGGKRK